MNKFFNSTSNNSHKKNLNGVLKNSWKRAIIITKKSEQLDLQWILHLILQVDFRGT